LHNPNVSEQAKENAARRLQEMGTEDNGHATTTTTTKAVRIEIEEEEEEDQLAEDTITAPELTDRQIGACIDRLVAVSNDEAQLATNPSYAVRFPREQITQREANNSLDAATSESAKEHSREILDAAGISVDHAGKPERGTEEEHEVRVLAGYKAALHSTSDV
jgi:hypothetical protein